MAVIESCRPAKPAYRHRQPVQGQKERFISNFSALYREQLQDDPELMYDACMTYWDRASAALQSTPHDQNAVKKELGVLEEMIRDYEKGNLYVPAAAYILSAIEYRLGRMERLADPRD